MQYLAVEIKSPRLPLGLDLRPVGSTTLTDAAEKPRGDRSPLRVLFGSDHQVCFGAWREALVAPSQSVSLADQRFLLETNSRPCQAATQKVAFFAKTRLLLQRVCSKVEAPPVSAVQQPAVVSGQHFGPAAPRILNAERRD